MHSDYRAALTEYLQTSGRDTSPTIARQLLALEPEHVGLERGRVTDQDLATLRHALEFAREQRASTRAARLHPIACTRPAPSEACTPPRKRAAH